MNWNESLKLYREQYGYSQKELSDLLNISTRTLQRYEAGDNEPTISILLKLSKLYEIGIDVIVANPNDNKFDVTKIEKHLKSIESSCNNLRREMYEAEEEKII